MKRGLFHMAIFMMLVYLFNKYVHYFYFKDLLPPDLFRSPYKELTSAEVSIWKFMLTWIIPGLIVIYFMKVTQFSKRVTHSWGVTLVNTVVIINLFQYLLKSPLLYMAAQVEGGGLSYVVSSYFGIFQFYSALPLGLALLAGTLKIFFTLEPLPSKSLTNQARRTPQSVASS